MKRDNAYYPSAFAGNKYFQYLRYLMEYARYNDWASIKSSFQLVLNGSTEKRKRVAESRLGKFFIRPGTTDFQFINYAYERKIRNYLKQNLSSFNVFIDVGACIGEYCIWLAKKGKRCYAFEPVPKNFDALKENAALNNVLEYLKAYPYGLGEKDEEVVFEVMETVTGSSHICRDNNKKGEKISIKRLDDLLNINKIQNSTPVIMKMDVEGMEVEVLKGAKDFVNRIQNLRIIYEHSFSGNEKIKAILLSAGNFDFTFLDKYNIMAIKK